MTRPDLWRDDPPHSSDPRLVPRSNALFSAIVATVAASRAPITVRELAGWIGVSVDEAAQCIALHRYRRRHGDGDTALAALAFPVAGEWDLPEADDVVDEAALGLRSDRAG